MIILFLGCEQEPVDNILLNTDEALVNDSEFLTLNYVTDLDIPDVIGELTARVPAEQSKRTTSKIKYNNVDIYLKDIKEVIDEGSESSYSFALEVKDQPNHIYNLIMAKNSGGKFKEPYIIGYELTPEDMEAFFEGSEDFSKFKATYKYYSFDSFFNDSKLGKVGKNGDCGGGSTGGSGSPDPISNTPAGGSFTHAYQGHTVTSNFRDRDIQIPYGYSITINPGDGSSSTVVTNAITPVETITAGISDMGTAPTATLPNYSSETVTWTESRVDWGPGPDGGSGGSTRTECSRTVITMGSMRFETGISCVQISNHNKSYSPGINKNGACLDTSGVTVINTAAKPVQKLHGYIGLNANEIEYFGRNDTNRAKARQINRFLIDESFEINAIETAKKIVSGIMINQYIVNFMPLVKYPENSDYDSRYPKLTEYLKYELPKIANNQRIVDEINGITDVPKDVIKEALQWGKGPVIEIEQLGHSGENEKYGVYRGHVNSADINTLFLDVDLVNDIENLKNSQEFRDAIAFLIGVTILHEYVHLGDVMFGDSFWGELHMSSGNEEDEAGIVFEKAIFGETVWRTNAGIILNKQN